MDNVMKAVQLFEQKFMCSQAVFAGACTGALMVLGMKYGRFDANDLESRAEGNAKAVQFLEEFEKRKGSYICREILGCDIATEDGKNYARKNDLFGKFCPEMVRTAAQIVSEMIGSGE